MLLQRLNHGLDFSRGFLRALGQQAHFIGDHGKAATLFTGTRRFNGRVQGQQVGLFGNRADHFKHAADAAALRGQCADHLDRLINGDRQLVDLLQAAVDVLLAQLGLGLRTAHFACGVFGVFGHLLHGVGDFVDRRGHLIHLRGLLLATLLGLRRVVADLRRRLFQRRGGGLQVANDRAQLGGEGVEVPGELGDFIAPVGVETAGQITFAAGDIAHGLHRLF